MDQYTIEVYDSHNTCTTQRREFRSMGDAMRYTAKVSNNCAGKKAIIQNMYAWVEFSHGEVVAASDLKLMDEATGIVSA